MTRRPFVRFISGATGGGHRACAEALIAALGDRAETDVVDVMVNSGVWGVRRMPEIYSWFGRNRWAWGALWHGLNGRHRFRWSLSEPLWWMGPGTYREMVLDGQPDVIVNLHPSCCFGAVRSLKEGRDRAAILTVVTDPVSPHIAWFERDVDWMSVGSPEAWRRAVRAGMDPDRVEVMGHPVHPRVHRLVHDRHALRARFGWDRPTVLVTGGGDGVGLRASVQAARSVGARVVVICGRDSRTQERLASEPDLEVLGFVDDLPERMCAADVVLSKAGPSTLAECRAVGTPVIITSHMPGQEVGNLRWATEEGFGEVARREEDIVAAIGGWLEDTARRTALRQRAACRKEPDPARRIAESILVLAGVSETKSPASSLVSRPATCLVAPP